MYAHFVKNLPMIDINNGIGVIDKLDHRYGVTIDNEFIGIQYFTIKPDLSKQLFDLIIPESYHSRFDLYLMLINSRTVLPHIDFGNNIAINYYVNTSDGIVDFYKHKDPSQNNDHGNVFQFSDVEQVTRIQPAKNDIWILNTSQIHSVECRSNTERIAFCFQTNMPFQDVVSMMTEFHQNE